jgi:hypothetical protein
MSCGPIWRRGLTLGSGPMTVGLHRDAGLHRAVGLHGNMGLHGAGAYIGLWGYGPS